VFCAFILILTACLPRAILGRRNELALVNGEPISLEYIRMTFKSKHGDVLILLRDEGALNEYLDRAINLKLLSQEAYRVGLLEEEGVKTRVKGFKLTLAKERLLEDELAEVKDPKERDQKREEFISHLRASAKIEVRREYIPLLLPRRGDEGAEGGDQPPGQIIAQVGEEGITVGMIAKRLNAHALARLERNKALEIVERTLNKLIDDLLLRREAVKRGYADREEVLKEVKIFEEVLLRDRLYQEAIFFQVKTTDQEVERYYRDHPEEFTLPEMANISHILLKTREEAEGVFSELQEGVDFEHLALTRSADKRTSRKLGKIGWVARGRLDPNFERAAFLLNVGEISDIVETRFGFHIIRLENRRDEELMDFSKAKRMAHKRVLDKKRRERTDYWIGKLRERSDIEINDKRVEEVQKALMEGKVPKS
jgi:parvulin-like peptidyl-prolyl isomerase